MKRPSLLNAARRCGPDGGPSAALCVLLIALVALAPAALGKRIEFDNGDVYDGELVDDIPHGTGVYLWADGRRYEGGFRDNRFHGAGVYEWPEGGDSKIRPL